jgi:hypothetical protein
MKKTIALCLVAIVGVGAIGMYIWYWSSQPVEEVVASTPPTINKPPEMQTVRTPSFSFSLPAAFRIEQTPAANNQPLRIKTFISGSTGKQLSVTYAPLPAGGLTNLGDYNMRAKLTTTYTPTFLKKQPDNSKAFQRKSDNSEVSVFWQHKSHYVAIVASSNGVSNQDLAGLVESVIASWQWL